MMKYVVVVRGMLKSADENQSKATHDATIKMIGPMGRSMGNVGHQAHLNPQNRREFLAIDVWDNIEGPQKLLQDPTLAAEFAKLFEGQPNVTIWSATDWEAW
jgi:quinol monooxygenase YgiN